MDVTPPPQLHVVTSREITPAPQSSTSTSTPPMNDPLHTSIFYTYVKINGYACEMIVDNGKCVNDVSDSVLQWPGLSTISHPAPYNVS